MKTRTFVISTMALGGSARALANLANHFAARGDAVQILTLHGGTDAYALHPAIRRRNLGFRSPHPPASAESMSAAIAFATRFPQSLQLANDCASIAALRDALLDDEHEAIVGVGDATSVRVIAASQGLGARVVGWEQTDPFAYRSAWGATRRIVYPLADALVVLMPEHARAFPEARCVAIPNGAPHPAFGHPLPAGGERGHGRAVVGLGRLSWEKGFDVLIEAFARIAERNPEWTLEIFGDGYQRALLHGLVVRRGLEGRVLLPGTTNDPFAHAGLFVLSSYAEGFPNALLEAMSAGVAPVVVECGAAAAEIVRDGVDGLRVPRTINALANAMERLMRDDALRARLAARAPEVVERYSIDRVAARWDAILGGYERDGILFPIPVLTRNEAERYAAFADDPAAEANPHLRFAWARELAEHPAVTRAAAAVLGDCELLSTQLLVKPPHSERFVSWHQDSAWRDYKPGEVASAWVALTDADADNGCMQVVRGSHRARLPHRDRPEPENMVRLGKHAEVEINNVTDVVLKAGEMSIHHNDLLHGSRPNVSDRPRAGFVVRFKQCASC